ncbi:C40 family peptidase [Paenibacillus humicola]|uniref:C40 family peptidase n=1 Tax=Paenibacillus humicola TaxID=3110540 RepID=UPI00237A4F98|nr:C40 family peptidase [Paenibacillus humicola]
MFKKRLSRTIGIGICIALGFSAFTFGAPSKASAATPESLKLISVGKQFLGTPYLFGADSGSTTAFDCSSFTQYIFKKLGVTLPRTSSAQALKGKKVAKGYLSVGDLIFFNTSGKGISHVAIYAGNGKMLHSAGSGVKITSMNISYWKNKFVTARRVL